MALNNLKEKDFFFKFLFFIKNNIREHLFFCFFIFLFWVFLIIILPFNEEVVYSIIFLGVSFVILIFLETSFKEIIESKTMVLIDQYDDLYKKLLETSSFFYNISKRNLFFFNELIKLVENSFFLSLFYFLNFFKLFLYYYFYIFNFFLLFFRKFIFFFINIYTLFFFRFFFLLNSFFERLFIFS